MKNAMFRNLFFALTFTFLFACSADAEVDPYKSESTVSAEAAEFISSLGFGWNLGNTFDACSYSDRENKGNETETSWGMPVTTKEMIQAVRAQGFKTIRIPVSWHNHIKSQKNKVYTVDSSWIKRVKTVVDWSLEAGLRVIINIHHDNLSEAQMNTCYGFCVTQNPNMKVLSKNYLNSVWSQVAKEFKNYDECLIFEVLNEPRCVGTGYEWYGQGKNISDANKTICEYEKVCLQAIRAAGGKNESRYVMIPTYAANPDLTDNWSLPPDSAGRLIVSVHAYTPYEFCMNEDGEKIFTKNHEANLAWLFQSLSEKFLSKGLAVIIGEMSASDKGNLGERIKWTDSYVSKAKSAGIPLVLWDNMVTYPAGQKGERHGYFNRKNLTWFYPELVEFAKE
ncbi:MAG: glycoside hydrolase family 5 protein [Treponema sp.]|nr:glycoside hydrolase family 5 protein [Treponema sp.]